MNKVILSGNLTRDPELRYTPSGKAMTKAGIAVRRLFATKNSDGTTTDVDFFNLTVWDKEAEFCQRYMKKGSAVILEGRVQTYSYEKDGVKKTGVDIQVERIEFAGSRRSNADGDEGGGYYDKKDSGKNYNSTPPDDDFPGDDADTPF